MKKLLVIGVLIFFTTTLKAQSYYNFGEGLDTSPEYGNLDYWIDGSLQFIVRSDGTKYLSYDVLCYVYDPLTLSSDGWPLGVYGEVMINGQSVELNFVKSSCCSNAFYDGEAEFSSYGELELDPSINISDIGLATYDIDYIIKYFDIVFNW